MTTIQILDMESSAERMQSLIDDFNAQLRLHNLAGCKKTMARIENELEHMRRVARPNPQIRRKA